MFIDAHFHADDLAEHDPEFTRFYTEAGVVGLASVHDEAGLERTRSIMAGAGRVLVSFGIHPQQAVMDEAGGMERLAATGALAAVGECGFDFFGDSPGTERTARNERDQREAFEFQLALALRYDLPLVLHLRRAGGELFEYAPRLARLRAVILHSWPGPPNEALSFLARCPRALFSFGLAISNGNKQARKSAAALPDHAILTETDAPYQPPRGPARQGSTNDYRPRERAYSTSADLPRVVASLASARGQSAEALAARVEANFMGVFAHGL